MTLQAILTHWAERKRSGGCDDISPSCTIEQQIKQGAATNKPFTLFYKETDLKPTSKNIVRIRIKQTQIDRIQS